MALHWRAEGSETKAWNHTLSEQDFTNIKQALNKLDVTKISGSIGTIYTKDDWRIDLQSPARDAYNVQIQRNSALPTPRPLPLYSSRSR